MTAFTDKVTNPYRLGRARLSLVPAHDPHNEPVYRSRRAGGSVGNDSLDWPERLGPDGTPLFDDPVVAAERASKLADDLAAIVEQVLTRLGWQATALAAVVPADAHSRQHLNDARHTNKRFALALEQIRDRLGEQHVAMDMQADHLHRLLPPVETHTDATPTTATSDGRSVGASGASKQPDTNPVAG